MTDDSTAFGIGCFLGFIFGVVFMASWIWAAAHVVIR